MVHGYYNLLGHNFMADCSIFNKPLVLDVNNIEAVNISTSLTWLRSIIPSYDVNFSGIWRPVFINGDQSTTEYGDPLIKARTGPTSSFSPCNCSDNSINPVSIDEEITEYNICDYCGDYNTNWKLYDNKRNASPREYPATCCDGACDVRFKTDDYLPKIPVLNQAYLTGVNDFKYHSQFPACSNPGLGKERFITIQDRNRSKILGPDLCIDWRLKETISEVAYDEYYSHHDSEFLHDKSYAKSKIVSKTCGNFILLSLPNGTENSNNWYQANYPLLSGLIGTAGITNDIPTSILPTPDQFANIPYGIDEEKYKNIFIKNQKAGSFWKWNYGSGVLCWYRYYETDRPSAEEKRPIPGVDLYISPGDVFFATNDGPEPLGNMVDPFGTNFIRNCPSGLKLTNGPELECIVPSGSNFCYISANIYDRFYQIYTVLSSRTDSYIDAFNTSAILSTSPMYDQITLDLLKRNITYSYDVNEYSQLDMFNRQMQVTTAYDSLSKLNYISNKKELINTLANKYGAYLWVPPNTTQSITFNQSVSSSFAIDLDFDMVIKKTDTIWGSSTCTSLRGCNERSLRKNYSYSQSIGFEGSTLSTTTSDEIRYFNSCSNGTVVSSGHSMFSSISINSSKIKSILTSSGCIYFEDIYKRIAERNTSTFCTDCDYNSSFYLIPDAETEECGKYNEDESFCYAVLARRFNNSPKQFEEDTQNRTARAISDGTIRWKRGYKSLFFNPHIDTVAFHQEGGIFVNSIPFGLDNFTAFEKNASASDISTNTINISFTTKDVGIKLYSLAAEYLQTNNREYAKCKRFPVKNSCQCLPITFSPTHPISCDDPEPSSFSTSNVYTPSLSTRLAPRLKEFGGYTQSYLNSIFGDGTLSAGTTLPTLNTKIDPINPYGCDTTAPITLYNYTNTSWDLKLTNMSTSHADIYVGASENINLLSQRYRISLESDFSFKAFIPFPEFKRFATKVSINNINLYSDQNKLIFAKDNSIPSNVTVDLQNPFLESLILAGGGSANSVLYPPSGRLLNNYIFNESQITFPRGRSDNHRGDESSSVNLTFTQKYRTQILNFVIPQPTAMGVLTKGFFHPNSGLTSSTKDKSPIKDNTIFYDAALSPNDFDPGFCLYGTFNNRVINTIKSIDSFNDHKKLRLYLYINGKWYMHDRHNRGGYKVNDKIYVGEPNMFEYVKNITKSQNLPSIFPAIAKKHTDFNYLYNHYPYGINAKAEFPLSSNKFTYIDKEVIVPGTRHYFMVPEIDPAIDTGLNSIDEISSFTPPNNLVFGKTIKFTDGSHWLLINPQAPISRSSYVFTDYAYLDHVFSDTHLDFTKISKNGYLYNTEKVCNFPFATYDPISRQWDTANTIISKKIMVKFVKKDGTPIKNLSSNNVYMIPYTVFTTTLNVRNKQYNTLDLLDSQNISDPIKNFHSFIITSITAPVAENDQLLLNKFIPSKWGDMINYDGQLLDNFSNVFVNVKDFYPDSTYNNDFYKILINNHKKTDHIYKIMYNNPEPTGFTFTHNDLVYYNILQKYNIGDNQAYSLQDSQYHNYLPFLDLNILKSGLNREDFQLAEQDETFTQQLENSIDNKIPLTGLMNIGGILNSLTSYSSDYINPDSDKYFWINFNAGELAKSAFVPANNIYSKTLRIDDPPYWLFSTNVSETSLPLRQDGNTSYSCRETFRPAGLSSYSAGVTRFENSSSYRVVANARANPYFRYPIYCDTDDDSCHNEGCWGPEGNSSYGGIQQVGWVNLKSNYRIGVEQSVSIPDSVPFMLSYDAGVYNIIGNDSYVKIKRFELTPGNEIEFDSFACNSSNVFPSNYKSSSVNPVYQKTLDETSDVDHSIIVTNTDRLANEMLFRILYGESEFINKKMLYVDNNVLSKNDLIKYSDPPVEAKDIYDQILYNFDKTAVMTNLNLNGTFNIQGVAAVGKTININIASISSSLNIVRENGKIYIRGTITGGRVTENVNVPIYTEYTEDKNYIIQSWGRGAVAPTAPSSPSDDVSIVFVGDCNIPNRRTYAIIATEDLGFPIPRQYDQRPSGPLPADASLAEIFGPTVELEKIQPTWQGTSGHESYGRGGGCCCGGFGCGGGCPINTTTFIDRVMALQNICGEIAYGYVGLVPPVTEQITYCPEDIAATPGAGSCASYDVGYCRKRACESCEEITDVIDEKNFSYSFEQCRTRFNLFGHAYKQSRRANLPSTRIIPRENVPIIYSLKEQEDAIKNNAWNGLSPAYNEVGEVIGCRLTTGPVGACSAESQPCAFTACDWPERLRFFDPPCAFGPCDYCWTGSFFDDINRNNPYNIAGVATTDGITQNSFRNFGYTMPNGRETGRGIDLCTEHSEYCGVSVAGDRDILTYRKIYLQTTRNSSTPYNPLCASSVITVSYTSKAITFNIGGENFCINLSSSTCPTITLSSTMSQLSVSDTIASSCDKCSPNSASVSLEKQAQDFLTVKEKRKCIIGIRYVNNVNPRGGTTWGEWYFTGSRSWSHRCGGGSIEYGCLEFGQELYLYPDPADTFMPISVTCNIPLPGDVQESVAAYDIPEWIWELNQIYKSRYSYLGKGSSHIPEEDIIEGIVPGTVTEIQLESFSMGGSKRDRIGIIGGNVLTAYVAYYEYDYIRPVTITNILRQDSGVVCTSNSYAGGIPITELQSALEEGLRTGDTFPSVRTSLCSSLPFPPNYVSNFNFYAGGESFLYRSRGSVGGSSYTITNPDFKKDSNCASSVSCYYKHNVFICPDDACCVADLRVSSNVGAQPEGGNVLTESASKQTCTMSDNFPPQY